MTMQKFRWATPGGLFVLTIVVACAGYIIDRTVNGIDSKMQTIIQDDKDDRSQFWQRFQALQDKEQCTRYALESCCQGKASFNC